MSRLNHAASISTAYASSNALPHPHARLASGRWLAFTGWESNPLDSIEKFLSVTSNFLLSQAYPGATINVLDWSPSLHVAMYLGDGTFSEPREYELRAPPAGIPHKFIVFLRQSSEELDFLRALEEVKRFGFDAVEFLKGGLIQPESLNSMRGFGAFFEEALSCGRSLVWYSNAVAQA